MPSAAYYRAEAHRCRTLARGEPDAAAAPRLRKMAEEYDLIAEAVEDSDARRVATHLRQTAR